MNAFEGVSMSHALLIFVGGIILLLALVGLVKIVTMLAGGHKSKSGVIRRTKVVKRRVSGGITVVGPDGETQHFNSAEEMPEEMREKYEEFRRRALEARSESDE
jgi:hypothetical protein